MNNISEQAKKLIDNNLCYMVEMSNKRHIKVDRNELQRVVEGITGGDVVKLKQGLFNPSHFVDLVEDEERNAKFKEMVFSIEKHNQHEIEYNDSKNIKKLPDGVKSLKDIFAGTPLSTTKLLQ